MRLRGIFAKLDNVRIRNKLLMIYILCMFIPIFVVYLFLFMSIWEKVDAQRIYTLDSSMDRIRLQIATEVEQCVRIQEMINVNKRLNEALDVEYASPAAYIEEFTSYLAHELDYYRIGFRQIEEIMVYVDNQTIISGGNFAYLSDEVKKSAFYTELYRSSGYLSLVACDDKESGSRVLSLLGKYFLSPGKSQRFTRIDLNKDMLRWLARDEQLAGNAYLISQAGECVMQYTADPGLSLHDDSRQRESVRIEKNFGDEGLLAGWCLVGVFPKQNQWDTIFSTGGQAMLISVALFILGSVIILIISHSIVMRLNAVSSYLRSSTAANHEPLKIVPGKDEIGTMILEMNRSTVRTRQLIDMVYKRELERTRAELHALQSQIQPHFLYNTLNSIRLKCLLDGSPDAANMLKRLAVMLRRIIGWQDDIVTLQDEIDSIIDFLEIQKFRYMDKLTYHIHTPQDLMDYRIPKLILQPLVENASFHGTELSERDGWIRVDIRRHGSGIRVVVRDNGVGIPADRLRELNVLLSNRGEFSSESVGIRNVCRRLRYYYGDRGTMRVISIAGKGTAVILTLGQIQSARSEEDPSPSPAKSD